MKIFFYTIVFLLCIRPCDTCGDISNKYRFDWNAIADSSMVSLNVHFWNTAGYYNNASPSDSKFNYWPQAHALDVLVDAYNRTGKSAYVEYMNNWFVGVKIKNGSTFLNEFYDDMEWNALAMHRAYQSTHDKKWLGATLEVWEDIKTGWNNTMGGGIGWRKSQIYYKNTPANAPACILASRLYIETGNVDDLTWAKKIYAWMKETLVDPNTGLVYDGINGENDGKLQDKPSWSFAYNQGTFIGAALELYSITKDKLYLNDAIKTADNFINSSIMSPEGIMRSGDNGDGGLFNGIGVRYLTLLICSPDISTSTRSTYIGYLKHNAETLWQQGTVKPEVIFNSSWKVKSGKTGYLSTQLSGCMLMEAMALMEKRNYLK